MKYALCHPDRKYFAKNLCHKCYMAKWARDNYPKNAEKLRQRSRDYYRDNRERVLERAAFIRSLPEHKEYRKNYRQRPEVKEEHRKRMQTRNTSEEGKKYKRQWRKRNPRKVSATKRKRRATRSSASTIIFTEKQWQELCLLFEHVCPGCSEQKKLTVDHVLPISLGGTSEIKNIQPLCLSCNSRKGVSTIDFRPPEVIKWATKQQATQLFSSQLSQQHRQQFKDMVPEME